MSGVFYYKYSMGPVELMALKTHIVEKKNSKNNQEWSWEETPELLAALEQLEKSSQVVKDIGYSLRKR